MSKKINLEEIILDIYGCQNVEDFQKSFDVSIKMTKDICKQACKQILELAAENAKVEEFYRGESYRIKDIFYDNDDSYIVANKQSILDTIKQVE